MPYTAAHAFDLFYDAINLRGNHRTAANVRKDWVVGRLSRSMDVLEARAIGSIPRYTALAGHADLDILVALHYGKHLKGESPASVLAAVKAALGSGAGDYRRNGQAVTVSFQSWPNVDVVPAVRYTSNGVVITSRSRTCTGASGSRRTGQARGEDPGGRGGTWRGVPRGDHDGEALEPAAGRAAAELPRRGDRAADRVLEGRARLVGTPVAGDGGGTDALVLGR